ncbi:MAG: hypothetical protein WDO16_20515 [Bacteroidota bacterium]
MKKLLFIVSLFFTTSISLPLFAQDTDEDDGNEKIRDKMSEYIQKRLDLSKDEADKFAPLFIRYFKEWRQTIRDNKGDRLVMQQRIIELRLRYRDQFKDVIGEKKSNQIFIHQDRFIQEIKTLRQERLRNNPNRVPVRPRVNRLSQI